MGVAAAEVAGAHGRIDTTLAARAEGSHDRGEYLIIYVPFYFPRRPTYATIFSPFKERFSQYSLGVAWIKK